MQGDIVAITNANGNIVVEYVYDSWGKLISISGSHAGPLGTKNHFLYRGYYFDYELSLYYLNSRYYDPVTKRFINADSYSSTGQGLSGNNMFVYCGDNPVNLVDPTGESYIDAFYKVFEGILNIVAEIEGSSESVGSAQPYIEMPGSYDYNSPNCYSYAIGSDKNEQPGASSGRAVSNWADVYDVGESVVSDLHAKGCTARPLSGPKGKILENEYRIALRVGTKPFACINGTPYYDYHFMRQTDTGYWAEKHGIGGASVLWDDPSLTPDTIPWTLNGELYYDSPIIYYAVGNWG